MEREIEATILIAVNGPRGQQVIFVHPQPSIAAVSGNRHALGAATGTIAPEVVSGDASQQGGLSNVGSGSFHRSGSMDAPSSFPQNLSSSFSSISINSEPSSGFHPSSSGSHRSSLTSGADIGSIGSPDSAPASASSASSSVSNQNDNSLSKSLMDNVFGVPSSVLARLLCPAKTTLHGSLLSSTIDDLMLVAMPCNLNAGHGIFSFPVDDDEEDELDSEDEAAHGGENRPSSSSSSSASLLSSSSSPSSMDSSSPLSESSPPPVQSSSFLEGSKPSSSSSTPKASNRPREELTHFSIALAFDTSTPRAYQEAYSRFLHSLTKACLREEARCRFLRTELERISYLKDRSHEWRQISEASLGESELARDLIKVIQSIRQGRTLQLRVNSWVELAVRFPPVPSTSEQQSKLEKYFSSSSSSSFATIPISSSCLIHPYEALIQEQETPHLEISPDGLQAVQQVMDAVAPWRSLSDIAKHTGLSAQLVCAIATHLTRWGVTRPVPVLTEHSLICTSPRASFPLPLALTSHFSRFFPAFGPLPAVLSRLSTPASIRHFASYFAVSSQRFKSAAAWMLKHRLIRHLQKFVVLSLPSLSQPGLIRSLRSDSSPEAQLVDIDWEYLRSFSASPHLFDLFRRVCKYFTGRYCVEEICWREGVSTEELYSVLVAYHEVLLHFQKPHDG